jgi:branched-chain amino acid transport system substrate-binding protein
MKRFLIFAVLLSVSTGALWPELLLGETIKVGVQVALTGDLAQSGQDQQNALVLANEKLGQGRYELIFEDDACSSREALSVARKFIDIHKVRYVIGFTCNQTLLSTVPVYEKAGVLTISSGGTSGDLPNIGQRSFRIFPSDMFGALRLFEYLKRRVKSLAIVTEQTEYAVMMERSFRQASTQAGNPINLMSDAFNHADGDFRSLLTRFKSAGVDALYLNADSDSSFITLLKQAAAVKLNKPIYAVYLGASSTVQAAVPNLVEGLVFSNLPKMESLLTPSGLDVLREFRKRFGEPKSGFPVVPSTLEMFRVLDLAIHSGQDPGAFLKGRTFSGGFMPSFSFDKDGNIQGLAFEIQQVKNGKVVVLEK